MLKRAVIIALAMVVVYNTCLLSPRFRNQCSVQSQWQKNLITAQNYLLADSAPDVVVVGSSLAAQLPQKALAPRIYNLSFAGGSLFTGLELIEASKSKPKLVVIEINVVWRKVDQQIVDNVSRPGFAWLRNFAPAFQEQFQPANVLAGNHTRLWLEKLSDAKARLPHEAKSKLDDDMFQRMLDIALEKGRTPVEPELMSEQIAFLHQHVTRLQNEGVRCVFLRMPIDPTLAKSVRPSGIRARMLEEFPPSKYEWIVPEPDHTYATLDGQHLKSTDAEDYALRIRTVLEQTNSWPTMRTASVAE